MGYIAYFNPSSSGAGGYKRVRIDFESINDGLGKTSTLKAGLMTGFIFDAYMPEIVTIETGGMGTIGNTNVPTTDLKFDFPNCIDVATNGFGNSGYSSATVNLPKCQHLNYRSFYNARVRSVTLASTIEEIPIECFENTNLIRYLSPMPFLKRIQDRGLAGNQQLVWTLPSSVTYIGNWGLSQCRNVTGTLPSGVTFIGERGLSGCVNINIPNIPPNLESLQPHQFSSCEKATFTSIPSRFTSLPDGVFNNTRHTVTNFPYVTSYGSASLGGNPNLTNVILGRVGTPVTHITPEQTVGIYINGTFNNSPNLTQIVVYTTGGVPIAGAPWGATNANVIFLSA